MELYCYCDTLAQTSPHDLCEKTSFISLSMGVNIQPEKWRQDLEYRARIYCVNLLAVIPWHKHEAPRSLKGQVAGGYSIFVLLRNWEVGREKPDSTGTLESCSGPHSRNNSQCWPPVMDWVGRVFQTVCFVVFFLFWYGIFLSALLKWSSTSHLHADSVEQVELVTMSKKTLKCWGKHAIGNTV